ncbi:MAG TPA: tetratricopeptide repeat protein [Casimicrobiaceae bacterium]|nr:tetratricopeptide repeat protein [Casimicrobiaceae bacterium]
MKDSRDVPASTSSAKALEHYEIALTQLQSYTGDPIATLQQALKADPEFALAHLFAALATYTTSEQRYLPAVRESVAKAAALEARMNSRERRLLGAARLLSDGQWRDASRALDALLIDYPRDALAIQIAHLMDFYQGDALNLRNRISRVLPYWSESTPGYSYVLGMHAFGLEECNQYADAERTGRRALELQPRDGWAVHAVAHVMEMQGRSAEGIDWLQSREADWAPNSTFAPHNWWHLALFRMDRGEFAAALDLFDQKVMPQGDMILVLIDASALLWRLRLEGVDIGDRYERVADAWKAKLNDEAGFYAFNDVHALMSFAAVGRDNEIVRLRSAMAAAVKRQDFNAMMTRDVGLPLVDGFCAFGAGRYREAGAAIEAVRDIANRFGGSHAQRDLLTLTLVEAAIRSGDTRRARHFIAERQMHKPTGWSERLLERADRANAAAIADTRIVEEMTIAA